VPEAMKTAKLCLKAVKQSGYVLQFVPEKFKTPELCLEAVKQCGSALAFVPEKLKTAEVCFEAVKQRGSALLHVPKALKIAELCLKAITEKDDTWVVNAIPKAIKTAEFYLKAIKINGFVIGDMPKKLITAQLCLEAIKHVYTERHDEYCVFKFIPLKFRTKEIYLEAIKQNILVLKHNTKFIPKEFFQCFKDINFCIEAVKRNKNAFDYVPRAMQKEVRKALKQGGEK
jgi:uncharacterized protein with HEPN domain